MKIIVKLIKNYIYFVLLTRVLSILSILFINVRVMSMSYNIKRT